MSCTWQCCAKRSTRAPRRGVVEDGATLLEGEVGHYDKLGNCFAHGRFTIHGGTHLEIELHDVNQNGPTFDPRCDAAHVVELAKLVLAAAHNHTAAIALPVPDEESRASAALHMALAAQA